MNNRIKTALSELFQRNAEIWQQEKGSLPEQLFDPEWLSPCQVEKLDGQVVTWSPVERSEETTLNNIEEALEITLHPSIEELYCSYYAGVLPCLFDGHPIELIQVWNEEDFNLLQENMIAHFMMQKRLKKPASMFIASCSDEMQIISILNDTGEVQLETLGKKQEAILAPDLASFLDLLEPVISHED
ncbi:SecY-interacting protein [Psychromonas sp. psych-6C06]|uniref:SecY-interacting protein n=1 Tax=Psychromonas sp. psych-6C06 TaxID=2058089 RepID=UPI000C340229|nr:SecY-interacting protein [Psychromonas sp. psych-6C06]PKF63365.1 SecY-interacting protein [Psychromonas sp. psych-6C06]